MGFGMGYKYIGRRYAHRVIWERHHGPIPPGWVIHHLDEDKGNNAIENLVAMPKAEHQRLHRKDQPNSDVQKQAAARTLERLRTPKSARCLHCHGEFVSHSVGQPGKFCSRPCLEKWRSSRFVPEVRCCQVCGKEYLAKKSFQRYCSKACNNKSKIRTYRSNPTGGKKRKTLAELSDIQPDG